MSGHAGDLAEDLLEQGIRAMKFWPFDQFGVTLAGPSNPHGEVTIWGQGTAAGLLAHTSTMRICSGVLPCVKDIRQAVGDKMKIAIEGHAALGLANVYPHSRGRWSRTIFCGLKKLCRRTIPRHMSGSKPATTVPICQSERIFTRFGFRHIIEKNVADIIMPDLSWGGGITETRKICSMADTYYLPVTLHDTIGPVALWAATHVMLHIPMRPIMETVRGYYDGWYNDVVTDRIPIRDGFLSLEW